MKATNETIYSILTSEQNKKQKSFLLFKDETIDTIDLNHIDVSQVTHLGQRPFKYFLSLPDISEWEIKQIQDLNEIFTESIFTVYNINNWNEYKTFINKINFSKKLKYL